MKEEKDRNVGAGMARCCSWSVETPTKKGVHQPLRDVSSAQLPYGRGDGGVCPGLWPKGHHSRFLAVFRTPRSPVAFSFLPLVVLLPDETRELQ